MASLSKNKILLQGRIPNFKNQRYLGRKITNFEKNNKMGKIGPTELLIFIVIPILILFFIFKTGQWYGQSKKDKKN